MLDSDVERSSIIPPAMAFCHTRLSAGCSGKDGKMQGEEKYLVDPSLHAKENENESNVASSCKTTQKV